MATFAQLREQDRILHVKDKLMLLLQDIIRHPNKLKTYIPEDNEHYKTISELLAKAIKKSGCTCGACVNIAFMNKHLPVELEALIDVARKEAESAVY